MARVKKKLPVLSIRLNKEKYLVSEDVIDTPEKAAELIREELSDYAREAFYVLYLSNANLPIASGIISEGTINQTLVSPVQIFQTALLLNSNHMILFHNHPGGSLKPSPDDYKVTERIMAGAKLLDMEVLDHIIVAGSRFYSMKEEGTITFSQSDVNVLLKQAKGDI